MKSTFKNIQIGNQYFQPDVFIWLPSNPNFKLLVECEGFSNYPEGSVITADLAINRVLQAQGFKILRYSTDEVLNHPLGTSFNLCDYLRAHEQGKD